VELAGAIAELAKMALAKDFRAIDPRDARVIPIEAGDRVCRASSARYRVKHTSHSWRWGARCGLALLSLNARRKE
jgi:NADH dehydrogenase FAD-containing subunit